jgi:hypothetical protein
MKFQVESTQYADERGSAMIMAMFVLLLLTGMGISLLSLGQMEVKMSQAGLNTKKSFFLAEAGQEDGRMTLFNTNGGGEFSDDLADGVGGGAAGADGVIDFDRDNLQVVYDSDGNVNGFTGYGDDIPLRTMTALSDGFYAAFLTNDPAEGEANTIDSNDLVMITAIGVGPDRSVEVVQAIIDRRDLIPTMPPATITLLGPSPDFYGGASENHEYSGDDCAGVGGTPGLYVPIVGTIGSAAEADAETGIVYETCRGNNCTGGPTYESGPYGQEETFADLTDPTEETVIASGYGTIDPMWTDCQAVHDMMEELREAADVYCCLPPVCNTPTPDPCPIDDMTAEEMANVNLIFLDGDYDFNPPASQSGTVVCTGELTFEGRTSWEGILLAIGAGEFVRNGAGDRYISGAIMVADIAGPDNIYGTDDDCTGGPDDDGFDEASYDLSGGGEGQTIYCSDNINAANPPQPYDVVNFRQH